MMNVYSKRIGAAVVVLAALAGACGTSGDSGGSGSAATKTGWDKRYGAAVMAVSTDVDTANGALDKGERPVILSSCNQTQEDLAEARKALPVPDASADSALRSGLEAVATAARTCIEGGRAANQARVVEQAQREMKTARTKMDEASQAIAAWR